MLFEEIIRLAKKRGWKQQECGIAGLSGNIGTNFKKDGKVLTVSVAEEESMTYPDEDEIE